MIEFKNVTKKYRNHLALDDFTLSLPKGKIIGVVGENGSGKSTTLKLISGLIRPSKGSVTIEGEDITRKVSSAKVSYLSELDVYYSFYTVGETIGYYASLYRDFNRSKAEEILDYMKLDRSKKVKDLSKGNRGRLKIAVNLSREVPVILMDEPFSGLDPMVRDSIVKGLLSFVDFQTQTIIITTHEIKEIEPILDLVILIKDGKVLQMEEVEEIRIHQNLSIVEWMKKEYE
ncbi:ABC transporter ATP-binding protein [Fictibacillus terranigra]|uniref:ABC transporter ATP-binding protein n=1 Tax=Fictibacillus terranigra TaxID=3058424 RepID=A0ABT8E7Y4_9BACL|nr:ABC transporter ATP-binding protein [Fictibacillus sp. CENA-BCM004]MDN4073969.1 ABC transporter ATP-binding protein [Fictibacillus sp. CENA-BCM004]